MNIPEAIFSHKKRKIPQKTASNHYMYAKTYNKSQHLPLISCFAGCRHMKADSASGAYTKKTVFLPRGYVSLCEHFVKY